MDGGGFHFTRAVPVFRFGGSMSDDRLRRAIEAARCPDRARRLSEQIAQTNATLAGLIDAQERLDRRAEALRLQLVAAGVLPAEED